MSYNQQELIFTDSKIYYIEKNGEERQVMMDWEDELMKKSAEYVCENGGDILEIGFGMGISADYIQQQNINSHTIIESHPQVYNQARIWAEDKPNVRLILGTWLNVLKDLSEYDGIFYDTYADVDFKLFGEKVVDLTKEGTKLSWWNSCRDKKNIYGIEDVTYEYIPVRPPSNHYFKSTVYFLPKKQY